MARKKIRYFSFKKYLFVCYSLSEGNKVIWKECISSYLLTSFNDITVSILRCFPRSQAIPQNWMLTNILKDCYEYSRGFSSFLHKLSVCMNLSLFWLFVHKHELVQLTHCTQSESQSLSLRKFTLDNHVENSVLETHTVNRTGKYWAASCKDTDFHLRGNRAVSFFILPLLTAITLLSLNTQAIALLSLQFPDLHLHPYGAQITLARWT